MAEIEINNLASVGNVRDLPGYQLPPEAFTQALNLRFYNGGVESIGGRTQRFGTPSVAPHFAIPVSTISSTFWIYTSLTKAYVWDGATHTNITRQTASVDVDYTASQTREWNGTLFGGIPILNNGIDLPQYWPSLVSATKLANMADWPSTHRANVIRSFGPYLVALGLTVSGTSYPHRVLWSHPADPGSLPASWDVTDPTYDAGQQDLADIGAGVIFDGLPLGGRFYIYKEESTWRMSNLASAEFPFDFKTFLETSGILAPRCASVTGDGLRHAVVTQDDIILHNGVNAQSLLTKKYKRYLFNQIDTTNYRNSFLFTNPFFNEVWFCYPETGQINPNRALIINYKEGGISETEIDFRNAATGVIESSSGDTWASTSGSWDDDEGPWQESNRRKIIVCGTDATKLLQLDSGTTFDGDVIDVTLLREGLGVVGRTRDNEWIVDFSKMKFLHRVWLKVSGGPISVRMGFAPRPDGSVRWTTTQTFDPETQNYLDFNITGRALAIEITSQNSFRLEGYKLVGSVTGAF